MRTPAPQKQPETRERLEGALAIEVCRPVPLRRSRSSRSHRDRDREPRRLLPQARHEVEGAPANRRSAGRQWPGRGRTATPCRPARGRPRERAEVLGTLDLGQPCGLDARPVRRAQRRSPRTLGPPNPCRRQTVSSLAPAGRGEALSRRRDDGRRLHLRSTGQILDARPGLIEVMCETVGDLGRYNNDS